MIMRTIPRMMVTSMGLRERLTAWSMEEHTTCTVNSGRMRQYTLMFQRNSSNHSAMDSSIVKREIKGPERMKRTTAIMKENKRARLRE